MPQSGTEITKEVKSRKLVDGINWDFPRGKRAILYRDECPVGTASYGDAIYMILTAVNYM